MIETDKKYSPVPGSRLSQADAEKLGPWIEAIDSQGLNAEEALEQAKDPNCPAYGYINWDVNSAAHAHWLSEVRRLLRSVRVVVIDLQGEPQQVRAVISVPLKNEDDEEDHLKVYVPFEQVQNDPALIEYTIGKAIKELTSWREKYEAYCHTLLGFKECVGPVIEAIKTVEARQATATTKEKAVAEEKPKRTSRKTKVSEVKVAA